MCLRQTGTSAAGEVVTHAGNDDQFGAGYALGSVLGRRGGNHRIVGAVQDERRATHLSQERVARRGDDQGRRLTREAGEIEGRAIGAALGPRAHLRFA